MPAWMASRRYAIEVEGIFDGRRQSMEHQHTKPTAFEEKVQKLGLNRETCAASEELRRWCERNKEECYIPEWLLEQWGMSVDPNAPIQPKSRVA